MNAIAPPNGVETSPEHGSSNGIVRRTAALWVAGTGAVLLVAAAGLFVAVRWDEIPDEAKFAVICGLTGAFLLAGHRLRSRLPATGAVLYHLGAFLLPVDLAALNLRLGLSWQELLLAEGVLGAVAFGALGVFGSSVVLRRASWISVVAAAIGLGAVTPVPAPVALAVAAAGASVADARSQSARAWAAVAGFAPVLAVAWAGLADTVNLIDALGVPAAAEPAAALAAGMFAALVLVRSATAGRDVRDAYLAVAAIVASGTAAWAGADLSRAADTLVLPSVFVVVQLAALGAGRDPFWGRVTVPVALGTDVISMWPAALVGLAAVLAPVVTAPDGFFDPDPIMAAAVALLGLGWAAGAVRRAQEGAGGPWAVTAVSAAAAAVVTVEVATASAAATVAVLLAVGAAALWTRHRALVVVGAGACAYAPVVGWSRPGVALVAGLVGAVATAVGASALVRAGGRVDRPGAVVAAGSSVLALGLGALVGYEAVGHVVAVVLFIAAAWGISAYLEGADGEVANLPRVAMLVALPFTLGWAPSERLVVAGLLVTVFAVDAVRSGEPRFAYGAVAPAVVATGDVGFLAGLIVPHIGVLLAVSGVVWAGLAAAVPGPWRRPFEAGTGLAVVIGLLASAEDAASFGAALIVTGGLVLAAGIAGRSESLAHIGGAGILTGLWIELGTTGVTVAEAYVAPVAAHLLAAGWWSRRTREVSSWVAYAPAVAMLGGAAFVERLGDGAGWHAVVAGTIGVLAVAIGGHRRLGGPLLVGTGLLLALTVHESLAVAATIPTWAWLATGGTALLATGVAMERADVSPVDAGRRVVDVLATKFE